MFENSNLCLTRGIRVLMFQCAYFIWLQILRAQTIIIHLQMKSIDKPNVYIRDSVRVRDKLKLLYEGGPEKLQVSCVHLALKTNIY